MGHVQRCKDQDEQDRGHNATGVISPFPAVAIRWQGGDEKHAEEHQQDNDVHSGMVCLGVRVPAPHRGRPGQTCRSKNHSFGPLLGRA